MTIENGKEYCIVREEYTIYREYLVQCTTSKKSINMVKGCDKHCELIQNSEVITTNEKDFKYTVVELEAKDCKCRQVELAAINIQHRLEEPPSEVIQGPVPKKSKGKNKK